MTCLPAFKTCMVAAPALDLNLPRKYLVDLSPSSLHLTPALILKVSISCSSAFASWSLRASILSISLLVKMGFDKMPFSFSLVTSLPKALLFMSLSSSVLERNIDLRKSNFRCGFQCCGTCLIKKSNWDFIQLLLSSPEISVLNNLGKLLPLLDLWAIIKEVSTDAWSNLAPNSCHLIVALVEFAVSNGEAKI